MSNFVVNPYNFVAGAIDDTGLKSYHKFNEVSPNDILNVSEADASIGSAADIQISGATYNVDDGSPFGYSMLFESSGSPPTAGDSGVYGTSKSIWNYKHSTTAKWTMCFWLRWRTLTDYVWLNGNSQANGAGNYCYNSGNATFYNSIRNSDGDAILNFNSPNGYFPDTDNFYFYSVTYDQSLTDTNCEIRRNNADPETYDKTAFTPSNANSVEVRTIATMPQSPDWYANFNVCEWSEWDRVLTDAELAALFNGGSGAAIY